MKWWDRIKQKVFTSYAKWQGKQFNFSSWAGRTFWGIDNSTLATNETIYSVVTRLSNSMATLPLKMYQNYETANNSASDTLINNPNPNMTGFEFIRTLEVARDEKGNGYAVIERNARNQIRRLTPVVPDYVTPVLEQNTGELWYEITGLDGNRYYFHNMDVIHVKHIVGSNGLKGISPIDVLRNTIDFDRAVKEFSLKEMEGAPNSFVLKYGANVDQEKRERIIEDFKRFYKDNGGILFQEPGVEIDELGRSYVAADILTTERITRSRVANVYNIPSIMLNDSDSQSYSSNEQLMRMFVDLTLMPIVRQYEQEFNRKLLTSVERRNGYYFKFNTKALLRADTKTQADYYTKAIRSGWLTPDEVRMKEDEPPKGGNASKILISGDLYPIDIEPWDRQSSLKGGEPNDDEEE